MSYQWYFPNIDHHGSHGTEIYFDRQARADNSSVVYSYAWRFYYNPKHLIVRVSRKRNYTQKTSETSNMNGRPVALHLHPSFMTLSPYPSISYHLSLSIYGPSILTQSDPSNSTTLTHMPTQLAQAEMGNRLEIMAA